MYADLIPIHAQLLICHTSANVIECIDLKSSAIFNTLDKCDKAASIIIRVLEDNSAKIAHVLNHVLGALKKYCHFSLRTITPYLEEAGACRDCGDSEAGASRDVQFSLTLQGDCKIKLG